MDYLDNKYIIVCLILLLLLFFNNKTDITKDMIGGGIIATYIKKDIKNNQTALMTVQDTKIRYITSIAEFSIPSTNKYDIFTFIDITISSITPSIILCRYNNVGNFIKDYPIYDKSNYNKNYRFYKNIYTLQNIDLNSGDILKIIVPTTTVRLNQEPIILIAISGTDYNDMYKYLNYKNDPNKILTKKETKLLETYKILTNEEIESLKTYEIIKE
jgi:hypothetical protein